MIIGHPTSQFTAHFQFEIEIQKSLFPSTINYNLQNNFLLLCCRQISILRNYPKPEIKPFIFVFVIETNLVRLKQINHYDFNINKNAKSLKFLNLYTS